MGPATRNRGAIILSGFFYPALTDVFNGKSKTATSFPKILVSLIIFIRISTHNWSAKKLIIIEIDGIASFKENFSTDLIHWAGSTEDNLAFFENDVRSTELLAWVSHFSCKDFIPWNYSHTSIQFLRKPFRSSIDFTLNTPLSAMIYEPDIPGPSQSYSGVVWTKIDPSKP